LMASDSQLINIFGNLDAIFALNGQKITQDKVSDVIKVAHQGVNYYVKRYTSAGKGFKRFFGKPRVQGEWENLQWFAQWGIPTANLIGYGLEKKWGLFQRGAIITQEIPNTLDLAQFADQQGLSDNRLVKKISAQLAKITRTLHAHKFIHNDLKWRNILIDDNHQVYLIDCPLGDFWSGELLNYRKIKDLKTLDNRAKKHLSRTQRMRFFLSYVNNHCLTPDNKQLLLRLLQRRSRRHDKQSNLSLIFNKNY
ncbi:MAG TPA: lipopolysaccharide kinase InaA family protein, partial [Methylotenera sp.]|nr:lipopolysaccharide kinase InaA family protein [Methylotenera sp.]